MNTGLVTRTSYLAVAAFGLASANPVNAHVQNNYVAQDYGWLKPITSFYPAKTLSLKKRTLTPHEIAINIRDEGLPIAVIADISGVERKTVYSWLSGEGAIRPHNQDRLEKLHSLLTEGKTTEFRYLYRFWNRDLNGNGSLGTLLKQPELNTDAISEILKVLWPLAEKQKDLAQTSVSKPNLKANPFIRESREVGLSYDI